MTTEVLNLIANDAAPASDGVTFERRNPARPNEVVSVAPQSTAADVAAAVDAANRARDGWRATSPTARARILERAGDILAERAREIATELTDEEGKPLVDALNEAARAPQNLALYAAEAIRLTGTTFPSDEPGTLVYSQRDPLGVIAVITPWNFPLNLAARKIGPALGAGNTVVFKPSPITPLMGHRLAIALVDAGLPPGVLNVVHGDAAGQHLVADDRVAGVTFTGSTATGGRIHAALGAGRRAQLELGGNNPVVVLADADLDQAAAVVAASAFNLSGQACTGAGRLLVDDSVHDALVERVASIVGGYVLGDGAEAATTHGPLIDEAARDRVRSAVDDSIAAGAKVVFGASTSEHLGDGWFYPPTLLDNVDPAMRIANEEVFGPAVGIERIDGIDDALARANDSPYGLTAAICTTNLASAQHFAADIQAGMVRINRPTVGAAFNAPFGGIKASGTGVFKEQLGPGVFEFYTTSRTIFLAH
jgi:aldehyde dehydrogenase (NAD+)